MATVTNRHIPKQWNTFILPAGDKRMVALCGTRTSAKFMGIPGMTPQAVTLKNAAGEWRPGWCPHCIDSMLQGYKNEWQSIATVKSAQMVYDEVFWEMFRFIDTVVRNRKILYPKHNFQDNGTN